MSRRYLTLLFAIVPLALVAVHQLRAQMGAEGPVQWRHNYNDARREAESKGLPLLLDIGTDDCFYCVKLDQETFIDPRVAAMLNSRFIPLKIHAPQQPKLVEVLRVRAYPTLVFAAPDGRILKNIEGFQTATQFQDSMQRVLAGMTPEPGTRDYELAQKRIGENNFAQAIPALQRAMEESKSGPVYTNSKNLLDQLEQRAAERIRGAKQLHDEGKSAEAMKVVADAARDFPGLQATRNVGDMLASLAQHTNSPKTQRDRVAQVLLAQARDHYRSQDFLICLDRCETLVAQYGDLQEGKDAYALATEIKKNPEWMQKACNHLIDRLAAMYLALGEEMLARQQPQLAIQYFEKVVQSFPESRRAENARVRLDQIQGQPTKTVVFPSRSQ